ncbi:MAG: AAA family ATPase [Syntrophomonadaceae bacterium]|nr:AAA family ATPase [Syntrophomonadaceae bacterium]
MFRQFFGLRSYPFSNEIDPEHLFRGKDFTELDSRLKYLQQTRGIGLISGETGSGKSTALRRFIHLLNPSLYRYCHFSLSTVSVPDFYQGLAKLLGEEPRFKKIALFNQIQNAIWSLYHDRKLTPVIVLDEIHLSSNRLLEDLRLLFNFKLDSVNPFILILAGQPVIRNRLSLKIHQPLWQRIQVRYSMQGLDKEETGEYLRSRLKTAGTQEEVFIDSAIEAIYAITQGLPRVINNLATNCLLLAAGNKVHQVDQELVYLAQKELNF